LTRRESSLRRTAIGRQRGSDGNRPRTKAWLLLVHAASSWRSFFRRYGPAAGSLGLASRRLSRLLHDGKARGRPPDSRAGLRQGRPSPTRAAVHPLAIARAVPQACSWLLDPRCRGGWSRSRVITPSRTPSGDAPRDVAGRLEPFQPFDVSRSGSPAMARAPRPGSRWGGERSRSPAGAPLIGESREAPGWPPAGRCRNRVAHAGRRSRRRSAGAAWGRPGWFGGLHLALHRRQRLEVPHSIPRAANSSARVMPLLHRIGSPRAQHNRLGRRRQHQRQHGVAGAPLRLRPS